MKQYINSEKFEYVKKVVTVIYLNDDKDIQDCIHKEEL